MFPGTTMLNYLFWMLFGAMQILVVAGAYAWLNRYGKSVRWWQMALMYGCFLGLCLVVAGGFTLMGEYESQAGWYFIGVLGLLPVLAGAVLIRLFVFPKKAAG